MHINNVKNGACMRKIWILEVLGSISKKIRMDKLHPDQPHHLAPSWPRIRSNYVIRVWRVRRATRVAQVSDLTRHPKLGANGCHLLIQPEVRSSKKTTRLASVTGQKRATCLTFTSNAFSLRKSNACRSHLSDASWLLACEPRARFSLPQIRSLPYK